MIFWVIGLYFDGRDLNNIIFLLIVLYGFDKVSIVLF